jgi:hypothetical protein
LKSSVGEENQDKTVEGKTVELETSVEFVSKKLDEFDQQCRKLSEQQRQGQERDVRTIRKNLDSVIKDSNELANRKEAMLDLKCRSMKNNLVFTGLGGETNREDTEGKLRDFIFHELGLEHHIEFGNVHLFGRFQSGKDQPIVARFIYQGDLVCVKKSAYKLKGKRYGIHEQYPSEIEDRRRELYPVQKQYKQSGHKTKMVRDRLYIDGQLFRGSDALPMDVAPSASQVRTFSEATRSAPHKIVDLLIHARKQLTGHALMNKWTLDHTTAARKVSLPIHRANRRVTFP